MSTLTFGLEITQPPIQINKLHRDEVESRLQFAGFLVFHCPLKADAIEALKMLADSSHRVCVVLNLSYCPQLT